MRKKRITNPFSIQDDEIVFRVAINPKTLLKQFLRQCKKIIISLFKTTVSLVVVHYFPHCAALLLHQNLW